MGNILGDADIFIAAAALKKRDRLVTGNIAHFTRIPALRLENRIR
jgi:predicted nucleic acid-binding protein